MQPDGNGDDVSVMHQTLVDTLKQNGHIRTAHVEAAFRAVPRHLFLPEQPVETVYRDEAIVTKYRDGLPISSSSQPALMAMMLEQLDLEPGSRVLEIGAGTGYNAALMAEIVGTAGHVTTVEIAQDIAGTARAHIRAAGFDHVHVVCGDGGWGYPSGAPYDRIILTVGAWDIAPAWLEQLHPAGRLLVPLWIRGDTKCMAFAPTDGALSSTAICDCAFMRLQGAFAGPEGIITLGPEAGLRMAVDDRHQMDPDAVYQVLTQPSRDWSTGVRVTLSEIQHCLSFWLALHEPTYCFVIAQGALTERGLVPYLYGVSGQYRATWGVLDPTTLGVLMRPPGHAPCPDATENAAPFELFVRLIGPEEALAHRVLGHILAWDAAGRPPMDALSITAYPREMDYHPAVQERVVAKRWMQFVFGWHPRVP